VGEFKQKLLQIIKWVYQEERTLIDKLTGEERAEIGTLNKWSIKGIVAHIAFWKSLRAKSIDDVLRGEILKDIGDFNKINEEVFKKFRNSSWDDIISYSKEAHNYLKKIVDSTTEEDLNSKKSFPLLGDKEIWKIIIIYCCLHPLDHFDKYYANRSQSYRAKSRKNNVKQSENHAFSHFHQHRGQTDTVNITDYRQTGFEMA